MNKCALTFASRERLLFWLDWHRGCSCPSDVRRTRVNKLLCPLHHSHAHTHRATKAPAHALSTICRWGHSQHGQLLNQKYVLKCLFGCPGEKGDLQNSAHQMDAWTCHLDQDISNTGAKILSQKASSTPPSAYSCRSWVPRGKSTQFYRKRVFSRFLKHHSETVFLRFLSMMKVIGTHCTICYYQMSLLRVFLRFPFLCCSLWLTHGVFREYPAYTYCFAFIFFSLFILLYSWNCFAIWGLRKIWFYGGIWKTAYMGVLSPW